MKWISLVFRNLLALSVCIVLASFFVVLSNEIFNSSGNTTQVSHISYRHWLPLCAVVLCCAALAYGVVKTALPRLHPGISILLCGCFSLIIASVIGLTHPGYWLANLFELKRASVFFISGLLFGIMSYYMD